jgi:hypothetical protein
MTRRRFLSQAAGVATGGAVLALATIPPASAAAAPMAVLASCDPDPIFALVEDYRTAAKTVAAAAAEVSRREEMMIEQGLGTYPVICLPIDSRARQADADYGLLARIYRPATSAGPLQQSECGGPCISGCSNRTTQGDRG